jgi:hypothetical protein
MLKPRDLESAIRHPSKIARYESKPMKFIRLEMDRRRKWKWRFSLPLSITGSDMS